MIHRIVLLPPFSVDRALYAGRRLNRDSCGNDKLVSSLNAVSDLPPDAARQLDDLGFAVLPGPAVQGGWARLAEAYDQAVSAANPADVSTRSSTRVHDFVNRGPEFDGLYIYSPLLSACLRIIKRPFKLSTMLARTLEPGAPAQPLHVDVKRNEDGWPLVGFIVMIDEFHAGNGATRFVPGSHLWPFEPHTTGTEVREVLTCGSAGSVIVFNGSVWHGHTANRSKGCRRSIQGAFIPREARPAMDQASRLRSETFERLSDLAKYILDVGEWGEPSFGSHMNDVDLSGRTPRK